MAGGDAFFEEGIHWLHLAGSLGPRIVESARVSAVGVARRPGHARQEHAGGVHVRQRRGRVAVLLARDPVAASAACGCRSCSAAAASSRSNRTDCSCSSGARDCRGCCFRVSATSAATRRCIVISSRRSATGSAPEMSLERAMDDQRLMDQIYATSNPGSPKLGSRRRIPTSQSGCDRPLRHHHHRQRRRRRHAGPRAVATPRARILILERGDFVPAGGRELESGGGLEASALPDRRALARRARPRVPPYTHYCVGGNTKFWGSVLYRLRREDFEAIEHADGVSPAWPIDYETLEPYYERAERLYHVRGQHGVDPTEVPRGPFPYDAGPARARHGNASSPSCAALGLHPSPLPLGLLRPGEPDGCMLCNTCNSFPCKVHAKSDADVCCVRHATAAAERHAVDQRVRAPADHRRHRRERSRRSRSSGTARRFVSRRRSSSCRAAR